MMSGSGLLDSGTPFILSSLLTECENPIKGQHDMEQWFPHLDDDLNYLGIFVELKVLGSVSGNSGFSRSEVVSNDGPDLGNTAFL